jgi:conjugal transfer pilus assembly protein TraB
LRYEDKIQDLRDQIEALKKANQGLDNKVTGVSNNLKELLKDYVESLKREDMNVLSHGKRDESVTGLVSIEVSKKSSKGMLLHIPAGGFAEATLLTGVFAPIKGEPMPVLLRLDSLLIGPNKSRVPVDGAFLIGKAKGDPNTSRAIIQLHLLSLVKSDGEVVEKDVNGYVVDKDGIMGLKGKYVWNIEKTALLSMASGAFEGIGSALASGEKTTMTSPLGTVEKITGDMAKYAGYSGLSKAFTNINRIFQERLNEFAPAIYVFNQKRGLSIVFLRGVSLYNFKEVRDEKRLDYYRYPFSGLDVVDK